MNITKENLVFVTGQPKSWKSCFSPAKALDVSLRIKILVYRIIDLIKLREHDQLVVIVRRSNLEPEQETGVVRVEFILRSGTLETHWTLPISVQPHTVYYRTGYAKHSLRKIAVLVAGRLRHMIPEIEILRECEHGIESPYK